jgi:hypothetical protein
VILTDRAVNVSDPSLYVSFLGSDFVEEGRRAGRWLVERQKKTPDAVLNIVELQGTVGSAPALDRKKGFEEVIAGNPKLKVIRSQTGDFTRAKGKEVMEAFLKAEGKKINVLYAHNDDMAIGAIQAIEEAGLKPGKDIIVISIDGVKGAFEAMIAGKLNVTVECSPLLGPQLMQIAKDVVAGKPVPKRVVTQKACSRPKSRPRNSRTVNTDCDDDDIYRAGAGAARHQQGVYRRAGAEWRVAQSVSGRGAYADGAERRRQVHADQGADRRAYAGSWPDLLAGQAIRRSPRWMRRTTASALSIRK